MAWPSPMCLLAPESSLKEQPLLGTHCAHSRGNGWESWLRSHCEAPTGIWCVSHPLTSHGPKQGSGTTNGWALHFAFREVLQVSWQWMGYKILLQGREESRTENNNITHIKFKQNKENKAGRVDWKSQVSEYHEVGNITGKLRNFK